MEEHAAIIEWELVGIIVTLILGFGGVMIQTGRFINRLAVVEKRIDDHEEHCDERTTEQKQHNKKVDERLGEGSTKLALLEHGQERIESSQQRIETDMREVRRIVEKRPAGKG